MSDDTLPLVHTLHTSNTSWISLSKIDGLGRGDASHPLQILILNHRLGIQRGLFIITTGVINMRYYHSPPACVWHEERVGSCMAVGGWAIAAFSLSCCMTFSTAAAPRPAGAPRHFHQLLARKHKLDVSLVNVQSQRGSEQEVKSRSHRLNPWTPGGGGDCHNILVLSYENKLCVDWMHSDPPTTHPHH